jgi:glycolate oxidase FAD binding subunit
MALCTTALAGVVDYPARDMTITVRAGLTIAGLQELLAGENQRLPVDVPAADRATVGGALASNTSGPRRLGFGTLRDYVLGLSVVNDGGQEIKAGGRVVKNVAGYDLGKLFVGSLGTLGIITQVTLRLKPHPEESALLTLGVKPANLVSLFEVLHNSRTRPISMEMLNALSVQVFNKQLGHVLPETPWVMVIGFEDNREAVNWQVHQLIKEVPAEQGVEINVLAGAAAGPLAQALVDFAAWSEAALTFQANLLASATAAFCLQAADLPDHLHLQAHAGNGIVLGHVPGNLTGERAGVLLNGLLGAAVSAQGNLVVRRCPPAWKKSLPIWGKPRNDLWLMRRLKETLDPRDLFNPGRLV